MRRNAVCLQLKKKKKFYGLSVPPLFLCSHSNSTHQRNHTSSLIKKEDEPNVESLLVFEATEGFKTALHSLGAASASLRSHLATSTGALLKFPNLLRCTHHFLGPQITKP